MTALEIEARTLRDLIYRNPNSEKCREPISDSSWESVKKAWIADIRWLREHAPKHP
jgi:hypothetical protein